MGIWEIEKCQRASALISKNITTGIARAVQKLIDTELVTYTPATGRVKILGLRPHLNRFACYDYDVAVELYHILFRSYLGKYYLLHYNRLSEQLDYSPLDEEILVNFAISQYILQSFYFPNKYPTLNNTNPLLYTNSIYTENEQGNGELTLKNGSNIIYQGNFNILN